MSRITILSLRKAIAPNNKDINHSGFTIIELMIVIAVIGIMLAIGVPAIISITDKPGAQYAADELYGVLAKAKMRAVRSNTNCTITVNLPPINTYNRICLDEAARGEAGETVDLRKYRGDVLFSNSPNVADIGPTAAITFTPQGLATIAGQSGPVYIQERRNAIFYRVRTTIAGGISVDRYSDATGFWR